MRLTFGRALSRAAAEDADNFRAATWNYRWSGDYGSKRWKVSDPGAEGQDDVPVRRARLSADGHTVAVGFEREVRPAMQVQVAYNLAAADGHRVVGSVFLTVHEKGK